MVHNGYMYVAGELPKIKSMLAVIQCTVPMHAFKHATVVKCQWSYKKKKLDSSALLIIQKLLK